MRIVIITQCFLPEMGALSNRMYPIARQLASAGHQVTIATGMPNYPDGVIFQPYQGRRTMREDMDGFTVERTLYYPAPRNQSKWQQLRSYLSFVPAVYRSAMRAGPVDVVFVTSPPIFPAIAGMRVAKKRKAKLIFDLRDLWPDEIIAMGAAKEGSTPIKMVRRIERKMYRLSDVVSCTTHAFIDTVCKRGVSRERTVLMPNGADLKVFRPLSADNPISREYPFGDRFVVMYSGLLGLKHGLETILDAARHLKDEPGIVFFLRGKGPKKQALVEAVESEGLTNVLFGEERPLEDLPHIIARADACVTSLSPDPYLEKIISVKIFEYMAMEKPVVAAIAGESAKVITDANAGIVVPPGDSQGLADAIRTLAADREGAAAMGKRGRAHVEEHYDREKMAKRLESALCALVNR